MVDRGAAGSALRTIVYFDMQMFFASVKKRNASFPPSRPTPLAFMPTLRRELVFGAKHLHFSSLGISSRHRGQEPQRLFPAHNGAHICHARLARRYILSASVLSRRAYSMVSSPSSS
jgi:nucleotidyltransferase/DNA polymerase involved in DNA repair